MMLTIVLIEEDKLLRALFCEWLVADGHRVRLEAGPDGVADPSVDRVVVDLPNLLVQGAQIVARVGRRYPLAGLIGTSTQVKRPHAGTSSQARALGVAGLVPKPCSKRELLAAVAAATHGVR